jgi:tetratricopeptide (TPR) repeat protein
MDLPTTIFLASKNRIMKKYVFVVCITVLVSLSTQYAFAQKITSPPSGDNQKASVTQYMGFVETTITYNSPDVHSPKGEDRTGKIWGELVPYGTKNLHFGLSSEENPSPWRAGANENTTISFSEDVLINGEMLKAGSYGLFMEPGKAEWTIIFSKNSTSWGAYYYNKSEDALRISVEPKKSDFNEYLTYEFTERKLESCQAWMRWENLSVGFKIQIPDFTELYLNKMRQELRSGAGFQWQNWVTAANFCVQNKINLDEALQWSITAIEGKYVGQENFTTLQTKGLVLLAMGNLEEANTYILKAVNHPTASSGQVHQFGRGLIKKGYKDLAMDVFMANYKNNNGVWPTNVGMARGYSALGNYSSASKYAKKALKIAPDENNKQNLKEALILLKEGKDIN